jgi:hypothetical protein
MNYLFVYVVMLKVVPISARTGKRQQASPRAGKRPEEKPRRREKRAAA